MITLRPLQLSDAPLMLEWMHDHELVKDLHKDFSSMTIENCDNFINKAQDDKNNLHLAIALLEADTVNSTIAEADIPNLASDGTYLGTASLKDIDTTLGIAEFGIVIRRCATGKGYSIEAMKQILNKGFKDLHLRQIYWCVDSENKRALRFYDKNGYNRVNLKDYSVLYTHIVESGDYEQDKIDSYVWYIAEEQ
ncbi:diamine N-acetyltransferase [Butyrivibrio sp. INlla18]|uniref:GNAT family N-acetyltransferase n=1 Tax=Butyrivibrio sp. INlla18 TaxID=1520806 RepID=UPI000881555C|nr:GNAT family N-acetyltransferase [Butyrivibrio sp. INlla18]SDA73208.1 diamine N-acetyltransferase [Butyrivibrio sp. INlla18]